MCICSICSFPNDADLVFTFSIQMCKSIVNKYILLMESLNIQETQNMLLIEVEDCKR